MPAYCQFLSPLQDLSNIAYHSSYSRLGHHSDKTKLVAVLVLRLRALWSFSPAFVSINLFLAACKEFKCEAISSLYVTPFWAGNWLLKTDGKLGL